MRDGDTADISGYLLVRNFTSVEFIIVSSTNTIKGSIHYLLGSLVLWYYMAWDSVTVWYGFGWNDMVGAGVGWYVFAWVGVM